MTYWHMQLHPDDKHFGKERDILTQSSIIGLGQWPGGEGQIFQLNQYINNLIQ